MPEVSGLSITIDEDDDSVRTDPVTGTVETDQPDGGVVVQLRNTPPKVEGDGDDDWFANLADEIGDERLASICNDLIDAIEADDRSRQGTLTNLAAGLDGLGTQLKEPRSSVGDTSSAVEGQSSVTNPLLLEACLKGWANADAELLPAAGPVKIKDDGDETAIQDELSEALERDVNHWFTVTASEYYPDTSHMLLWGVYFGGSGFKKIYRCPLKRRPTSQSVATKDLIVSDTSKDLKSCERITHQIPMRSSVLKRMQLAGAYRDTTALTQPTPTRDVVSEQIAAIQGTQASKTRPEDQPYTIWETQCELDLPEYATGKFKGKGIPLPYLVTIEKDSRAILAIRRDWDEDDLDCERKRLYVKYPYVPGPGFYGTGMLNILGNASRAMTAAWRLALDAGMFASFPGGLIAKLGGRQNTSDMRVGPAQLLAIETNGQPINQIVMPLPYKDPSPGLMNLIDKITAQAKSVGTAVEIPASEGLQNVPVGTMLAQIEQATKIMLAAHKGMHTAASEEFELLFDLFRANPEDFIRSTKKNKNCPPGYWDEAKFLQALDDCQLIPVSDPNVPSHIHRIAKALGLAQLIAIPDFRPFLNPLETLKRILRAMREDPGGGLVIENPPPQPPPTNGKAPPDPLIGQAKMLDAKTNAAKAASAAQTEAQKAATEREQMAAEQKLRDTDLRKEMIIHGTEQAQAQRETGLEQDKLGLEAVKTAHEQQMDHREHTLKGVQALNEHELAQRQHATETAQAQQEHVAGLAQDQREHGLAVSAHHLDAATAAHDAEMARKQHELDEYTAKHPPKPTTPKPKS